jgi:hypothetical protein
MTIRSPIQVDLEGIYHDFPKDLIQTLKKRKTAKIVEESVMKRIELLNKAKEGDEDAIKTLREKYKIKSFIHRGKKII